MLGFWHAERLTGCGAALRQRQNFWQTILLWMLGDSRFAGDIPSVASLAG
jgi:hypothetical protein